MASETQTKTYRLTDATRELIDQLARDLALSKSDVLRSSVETLRDLLVVASADATGILAVIRDRHSDAENLTIDIGIARDGSPQPVVLIDGEEHLDVGARAVVMNRKAYIFLTIPDGSAAFAVAVGDEAVLVRPQFAAGAVEWPSAESHRIIIDLRVPAAAHTSAPAAVEA